MTSGGKENGLLSEINVVPLVDVMLVLLIIFMVAAPMMIHGASVSLPEATLDPITAEKEPLMITMDTQQRIYINDFEVQFDFLREKLAKILENRTDRMVYLRADKAIPYGLVARVMAEAKGAGVEKLGMVTEPIKTKEKR
ncbi:MAG: ExbD/TolR family protein [Deltaproteobacteria bacterium]|nr:ExbD/TolR family protein [Deltaproteobacteria bacterium]MBW2042448.1 ExbD/TolR family protein [Deltaproteobacteria bacterium]MBW2132705.1 ExbD/TolR family protein [Deltaproteobacteria bacterium]